MLRDRVANRRVERALSINRPLRTLLWRKRKQIHRSASGLLMKAALDYGRLGWSVIPIEPGGKRPLVPWEVYRHRQHEATEAADWFRRWPDANIAVVTGVVSGLVVLDWHPDGGAQADLDRLEREHGSFSDTVEARTGGGGRHIYFAHPGRMLRNQAAILPGLALYADGGYVVAPPSVHANGEPYSWKRSPEVSRLVPLPAWLLRTDIGGRAEPAAWRRLLREPVVAEERGDALAALADHLLGQGVDPDVARALLSSWNQVRCRPPMEPGAVERILSAMARRYGREPSDDG